MSNLRVIEIDHKWHAQVKRWGGKWKDLVDKKNNVRKFRKESDAWRIIEAYKAKGRGISFGWKSRIV